MITSEILKSIGNYSFEVHCPKVRVYQINGINLKGYGILKINNYGMIYIEFICLEKHNIPNQFDWSMRFPNDHLDVSQKTYLEGVSIHGMEFQAEDFKLELYPNSIHTDSVHHIILEKIRIIEHIENNEDYFYIEFNQKINIPKNKKNSVVSTLGSESFAWNESVINFTQENFKIRMVDEKETKSFISIEGCKNPELMLDCITFYLGFCSGILLQPYCSTYISRGQKVTTFYSTNKLDLKKSYAPAIASNVINSEFKDGEYHFNILRKSISLYTENPKHFFSIYAQWRRVWISFKSEQAITNLALTTAIEGLLNDIFIPIYKESIKDEALEHDITEIKGLIKNLEIASTYKQRLQNSISYLKDITANKALSLLVSSGILSQQEIESWKKLRNEVAHPKVKKNTLSNKYKERENFIFCLNLFNALILQTLNYKGPRNYFSPMKEEDIRLFESKILT